jgi:hypothetical protein
VKVYTLIHESDRILGFTVYGNAEAAASGVRSWLRLRALRDDDGELLRVLNEEGVEAALAFFNEQHRDQERLSLDERDVEGSWQKS